MDLHYKVCTPEHVEDVLRFLQAMHQERVLTLNRMQKLPSVADEINWLKKFDGKTGIVMAVWANDDIVAFLHAEILQPKELSGNCEFGLSVLAPYRKQGIATKLMTDVEKWARKRQVRRLELGVYSNNPKAYRLYEKLGFVEDGRRVAAVEIWNGEVVDLIHMSKVL